MEDGVVIDANIISEFYKEFIMEEGDLHDLIFWILNNHGIIVSDMIINEWTNTCNNDIIRSWVADGLKDGKMKYVNPLLENDIKKKIHVKYGLPKASHDIEYIKCSNVTLMKYILTNDIDFFDPKLKEASQKAKDNAKIKRKGKLCIFLKKQLGIIVGLPDHCKSDLSIPCNE